MGLSQVSHEVNVNNCFINNSIAINGNYCETLLLATNHQNLQNISLIQRQHMNALLLKAYYYVLNFDIYKKYFQIRTLSSFVTKTFHLLLK